MIAVTISSLPSLINDGDPALACASAERFKGDRVKETSVVFACYLLVILGAVACLHVLTDQGHENGRPQVLR